MTPAEIDAFFPPYRAPEPAEGEVVRDVSGSRHEAIRNGVKALATTFIENSQPDTPFQKDALEYLKAAYESANIAV